MTLLDTILDGLVVEVEPFALCEVRGGHLELGCQDQVTLHYGLRGAGAIRIDAWPEIAVAAGSVLIVPRLARHRISAAGAAVTPEAACAPIDLGQLLKPDRDGAPLVVACSTVNASYQGLSGLFDLMPEPLAARLQPDEPVRTAIDRLLTELAAPQPGSRALVRALMQQCLILLLRRSQLGESANAPWLAALHDPRLWQAARALFEHPEEDHTVASLAEHANMSRSAFADRFRRTFGRGPIALAKELRLRAAARLLAASDTPVKRIAEQVGYTSRSYFSRAFEARFDCAPSAYRNEFRKSLETSAAAAATAEIGPGTSVPDAPAPAQSQVDRGRSSTSDRPS